jgi:teichuronic acid exporter
METLAPHGAFTGPKTAPVAPDSYHPHLTLGRSRAAMVGVMWSSLHALIPTVSAALVFFISAAFLSPSDFGLVGLATALVSFALAFSPLAFGEALIQRKEISKSHADSVFWLTALFSAFVFVAFLLGANLIAKFVEQPLIAYLLPVLALRIPFELLAAVPNAMIIRSMQFKLVALRTAVATVASAVISISMLFAGYGYWALVASQISASFVVCVMAYWAAGWRPGLEYDFQKLKELASYGIFASANRMLNMLKLDHIILGALAGPQMLGLYFFAQRLYLMLTDLVAGALSSVSHALLSTLQNDQARMRQAFDVASFAAAAVSIPMFVGLALVIEDIVPLLFDPKWNGAIFPIKAFCAVGVVACISVVQCSLIKSQGRPNWWFYYQLVQQSTTVAIVALTYGRGLEFMLVAVVSKTILLWPISVVMSAKLLGSSVARYLMQFAAPVSAALIMAAAITFLPALVGEMQATTLIVLKVVMGIAVYSIAIMIISFSRIEELYTHLKSKGRN